MNCLSVGYLFLRRISILLGCFAFKKAHFVIPLYNFVLLRFVDFLASTQKLCGTSKEARVKNIKSIYGLIVLIMDDYLNNLVKAVHGGKVFSTNFLEPNEAADLAAKLRAQDINVELDGGFSGANRRVLTAFPNHIPKATASLSAVYFEGVNKDELIDRINSFGFKPASIGDIINLQEGSAVVLLSSVKNKLLELRGAQEVSPTDLSGRKSKAQQVIVPSLRVDVLGAKAFGVSRNYFAKGIANHKVSLQGKPAGKASSAELGDEIYAEGLGRFRVVELIGTTKKGNHKVMLEVEKS